MNIHDATYVIYFLFSTNRNIASSSITDVLISPMSRLSASSSIMSISSVGNQNPTCQRTVSNRKYCISSFKKTYQSHVWSVTMEFSRTSSTVFFHSIKIWLVLFTKKEIQQFLCIFVKEIESFCFVIITIYCWTDNFSLGLQW
jgi:hypothetical protein